MSRAYWENVAKALRRGERVFLGLVAENSRHSPGTRGAKLMITETGETLGTIGGGLMEQNLIARARAMLKHQNFYAGRETLRHNKSNSGEMPSGMICAGKQTNIYYLCDPGRDLPQIEQALELLHEDQPGELAISPAGLTVHRRQIDFSAAPILIAGNNQWRYREQLLNVRRAAIIGGGHCSLALSSALDKLGYNVMVFDTRENIQTLQDNVYARRRLTIDDYAAAGSLVPYQEITFLLVMTPDYLSDARGLQGALAQPFPFIGLMGSRAKFNQIFHHLRAAGFAQDELDRITAPAGLPIGSHTPEEIAISIAAQILQERSKRLPQLFFQH